MPKPNERDLIMNLIEYRKNGDSISNIQSRISWNLGGSNRHYRFAYITEYARTYDDSLNQRYARLMTVKNEYQAFGLEFNRLAIKQADIRATLRHINNHNIGNEWIEVLEDIFSEEFNSCDDCGVYTTYDDSFGVSGSGDRYCSDCISNYDDEDSEDDRGYEYIGSRHSSSHSLSRIPSAYDNRKPRVLLGMELELEVSDDYDLDNKAGHILENIGSYQNSEGNRFRYALIEEDCSIDRGFEIVTAYTGLDVHKKQLRFFKNRLHGCKSHNTSTCGLHVHICKSDMTTLHGAKMVLFINDPDNKQLVYALARRYENEYCKIHDKKEDKSWLKDALESNSKRSQLLRLNWDRYEALNFHNEKTVEFRLYKGSLKYQTIMACLEFTFAVWHFTRTAGANELKTADFLSFICKPENRMDSRFLRSYLKTKGFHLDYESKPDNRKAA